MPGAFPKPSFKPAIHPGDAARSGKAKRKPQASNNHRTRTAAPDLIQPSDSIPNGKISTEDDGLQSGGAETYAADAKRWQAETAILLREMQILRADATRLLALSESRQKIAELESDSPLWEVSRKQREMNEKEESTKAQERRKQAGFAQQESRARKGAAEAGKEREKAGRKAPEQDGESLAELRDIKQWSLAAERERNRLVHRDLTLWGRAPWTNESALARYKMLSEEFEKIKFSETQPLTFEAIPWPVLENPFDLEVQHLGWNMVEGFFAFVRAETGWTSAEYKSFVEKAHRMFHPDKWRSRGLLDTIPDEELRKYIETAGNVVVQALTPLWRNTKGYD